MSVELEPPESIRDRVESGPGYIAFPSRYWPNIWILLGFAVGLIPTGTIALGILMGVPGISPQQLGVLALGVGVCGLVGGLLGSIKAGRRRMLKITAEGGVFDGLAPPSPLRIDGLCLRGDPGSPVSLESGGETLAVFEIGEDGGGWDYDDVTWIAERIAQISGVEWADHRPESEWRRWMVDPDFRAQCLFERADRENRSDLSLFHQVEPSPPEHHSDLHGFRTRLEAPIAFDRSHLELAGHRLPLWKISGARAVYERRTRDNGVRYYGRLEVLVGQTRVSTRAAVVTDQAEGRCAHLNWLAEQIRMHAAEASPPEDRGGTEEVPKAMKELMSRKRAARAKDRSGSIR